jgi:hypothetical protein
MVFSSLSMSMFRHAKGLNAKARCREGAKGKDLSCFATLHLGFFALGFFVLFFYKPLTTR